MTETPDGADRFYDEHLVETPETLRDSNPENPDLDLGADENDRYAASDRFGVTAEEQQLGETLEMRLAEEEPEPDQPGGDSAAAAESDGSQRSAEQAAMHEVDEP
ncbi:MAG: hypothetical protein WCB04_06610 [Mycobacteriales bacterium]